MLLVGLYGPTLYTLAGRWWEDPNYSHGFLVPLISGWIAWCISRQMKVPAEGAVILGSLEILVGCLVHLAAVVIAWPPLDFFGLVFILRGIALVIGGRAWAKAYTFPIWFLFFMFPLPVTWTSAAAIWLQDVVSRVSAGVLNLFSVCYREGNTLYLAGAEPLVVAEECSGLRQIVAFVALAALIGYMARSSVRIWGAPAGARAEAGPRRPLAFGILLVLSAVPVAILANTVRVLLMAGGARHFGAGWMSTALHDAPAYVTMPLGLGLLLLVCWGLGRLWPPVPTEGQP